MPWINVKDQLPTDGQEVYYFSPILGLWRGKYTYSPFTHTVWYDENNVAHKEEAPDNLRNAVSPHVFFCSSGCCDTDEVTHWQPYDADAVSRGWVPLPPNHGITDDRMAEYRAWRDPFLIIDDPPEVFKQPSALSQPEWLDADKLMVDPPSGWRYGFPKVWNKKTHPDMTAWLIENGYPEAEARQGGLVCRFMSVPEEAPT